MKSAQRVLEIQALLADVPAPENQVQLHFDQGFPSTCGRVARMYRRMVRGRAVADVCRLVCERFMWACAASVPVFIVELLWGPFDDLGWEFATHVLGWFGLYCGCVVMPFALVYGVLETSMLYFLNSRPDLEAIRNMLHWVEEHQEALGQRRLAIVLRARDEALSD